MNTLLATAVRMQTTMFELRDRATAFRNDRRGVTAMEYGVIAAVTVVVVGAAVITAGTELKTIWTSINTTLTNAAA